MKPLFSLLIPVSEPEADPLLSRADDTFARKIFMAYTTRIPWLPWNGQKMTREEEACYSPKNPPKF